MTSIGPYVVKSEIARGGMGVVYRAYDPHLDRQVAIKLMLSIMSTDETNLKRFKREAQTLAKLRHPSIVAVHAVGRHQNHPYLVMDYVEGESLEERIERDGPLPVREAVRIARELSEALQHAHQEGIVHRDVKPDNVLLSRTGTPMLTDFGLAKDLDPEGSGSLSVDGRFMGTPGYWPPEQADGDLKRIGPHSDVYSLGATLYAMLVGEPPFVGENLPELALAMQRAFTPPKQRRPGVDEELNAICVRCLQKVPESRYDSAWQLASTLDQYLRATSTQEEIFAPPIERVRVPMTLHLLGGLTVVLGGLAAVLGFWLAASESSLRTTRGELEESQLQLAKAKGLAKGLEEELAAARAALDAQAAAATPEPRPADSAKAVERGMTRAVQSAKARDWEAALQAIEEVLALDPKCVPALLLRAGVKSEGYGDYKGTVEDCTEALRLRPEDPDAWDRRGVANFNLGAYADSVSDFTTALAKIPVDCPPARAILPRLLRAEEMLQRTERKVGGPATGKVWDRRGRFHSGNNDPRNALQAFTRAILNDPKNAGLYFHRASVFDALDDVKAELRDLDEAIRLDASFAQALNNRGITRVEEGDLKGGLRDMDRLVELTPDDARAHLNRAAVRMRLELHEGAIEDVERALALMDPADPGRAAAERALSKARKRAAAKK